jgi:hypothetical protein
MLRLERMLGGALTRRRWLKRQGYICELGWASCSFCSAQPESNIVGATAGLLEHLHLHRQAFLGPGPAAAEHRSARKIPAVAQGGLRRRRIHSKRHGELPGVIGRNTFAPWLRESINHDSPSN